MCIHRNECVRIPKKIEIKITRPRFRNTQMFLTLYLTLCLLPSISLTFYPPLSIYISLSLFPHFPPLSHLSLLFPSLSIPYSPLSLYLSLPLAFSLSTPSLSLSHSLTHSSPSISQISVPSWSIFMFICF